VLPAILEIGPIEIAKSKFYTYGQEIACASCDPQEQKTAAKWVILQKLKNNKNCNANIMEGADKRKAENVKNVRPCKRVRELEVDDEDEVEAEGDEDGEKEEVEAELEADDKEKDRKSDCSEEDKIEDQKLSPKLPVPPTVVVKQAIEYRIAPAPADTYPPDLRCNGCDQQNFIAGLSS